MTEPVIGYNILDFSVVYFFFSYVITFAAVVLVVILNLFFYIKYRKFFMEKQFGLMLCILLLCFLVVLFQGEYLIVILNPYVLICSYLISVSNKFVKVFSFINILTMILVLFTVQYADNDTNPELVDIIIWTVLYSAPAFFVILIVHIFDQARLKIKWLRYTIDVQLT